MPRAKHVKQTEAKQAKQEEDGTSTLLSKNVQETSIFEVGQI